MALQEESIQPPEEAPIDHSRCGLLYLFLVAEWRFRCFLQDQEDRLDHKRGSENTCNTVHRSYPKGSDEGNVEDDGYDEKCSDQLGWLPGISVFDKRQSGKRK